MKTGNRWRERAGAAVKRRLASTRRETAVGRTPAARALAWLRTHQAPGGGIRVHTTDPAGYPEVSGYLVPTLLTYGERDLATALVEWLVAIQRADGAFPDPDRGEPYRFDTGQVLRGLLAAGDLVPAANEAARRAADYLVTHMTDGGAYPNQYQGGVPEPVLLYTLPPLVAAAERFGEPKYRAAAERCRDAYIRHLEFLRLDDLTHYLAYEIEALIDLDRAEIAQPVLDEIAALQTAAGAVRGQGDVAWVCSPGLAQLAVCWLKVGQHEPAERAIVWLERHQDRDGAWFGSYGRGAKYFRGLKPSWTVKYFLDANWLRVKAFFDRNADSFPTEIDAGDGRVQAILDLVGTSRRVVEVGCGKGRFLARIRERYPDVECVGVDLSPRLLASLPAGMTAVEGSLENVPLPAGGFDFAFSVEAIEHSANEAAAVAELARLVRPDGVVAIIDKQASHAGRMQVQPWEAWPSSEALQCHLRRYCDNVVAIPVSHDQSAPDGMMVLWRGRRRGNLDGEGWFNVLLDPASRRRVVHRVRTGQLTPWGSDAIRATRPGETVLEIGCGTSEISLAMALAGRRVTVADMDERMLDFARECACELAVEIETVRLDATQPLPFADGAFDCVWSAGVLEHFPPADRARIFAEWARVANGAFLSYVPNAASLPYRIGKQEQEAQGTWAYGYEEPIASLRAEFSAAGFVDIAEYTLGLEYAVAFLPPRDPLRHRLAKVFAGWSERQVRDLGQGYLLVTKGRR